MDKGGIFMEVIVANPTEWQVIGNLIPGDLSALADTTPFTSSDTALAVETAETIVGYSLRKLEITTDF